MRETGLPLHGSLTDVTEIPHTVSYFIRKCAQILSFNDLPLEKRPPEYMWDSSNMLDDWFDTVFNREEKSNTTDGLTVIIEDEEYEG